MPPMLFENRERRRVMVALTTLYVVGCVLWLLSSARKHSAVVQKSGLAGADSTLPLPGDIEPRGAALTVGSEFKSFRIVGKRTDPSDTGSADDNDHDDESDDQDSDSATATDPNETWAKQVARGCQLVEMMNTPDAELEENQKTAWHSCDQLEQYGWEYSDEDPTGDLGSQPNADEQKESVNSALDALSIPRIPSDANDESGGWQKVAWIHSRDTTINGHTYPATRAYIINYYNPGYGIIIAANTKSASKMRPTLPKSQLVPLGQWSDITALTWADICQLHSQNPNTLKYIMRINVAGDVAEDILPRVLDRDLDGLGSYHDAVTVPGMPSSDEARAVIGFPNGRGVGYLLVQHKEIFGDRRGVRDVRVWNSNNGIQEQMAFFNEVPNMLYVFS